MGLMPALHLGALTKGSLHEVRGVGKETIHIQIFNRRKRQNAFKKFTCHALSKAKIKLMEHILLDLN